MEKLFKDTRLPCLFVVDNDDLVSDIKRHLGEKFADHQIARSKEEAEKLCSSEQPHIIFFGTRKLSTSEHIYLHLIKKVTNLDVHRAVLMVHASDSDTAYSFCEQKLFNDYIVINPLYDKQVFNMAILRSIDALNESKDFEKFGEIEGMLRKLQLSVNQNKKIDSAAQNKARAIQKQLRDTLNRELSALNSDVESQKAEGEEARRLKATIDSFSKSFSQTVDRVESGMSGVLDDWETASGQVFSELDSALQADTGKIEVKRTVLVVEDDPLYGSVLSKILDSAGYTVKTVTSGQLAIGKLGQFNIDLIMLDWNLPDMKGSKVLATIKNDISFCYIPVLVLTGHSQPEIVKEAISLGAADFIVKPSNKVQILQKIEAALFQNNG